MAEGCWRAGVDVGASLAKIAFHHPVEGWSWHLLPSDRLPEVAALLQSRGAGSVGLTGGGASALARRLAGGELRVNEFAAWGVGVRRLLAEAGREDVDPFLLVSVGTGTSAMAVDGMSVSRLGGTALGGGALLGLGRALLGRPVGFEELCDLAATGQRARIDLRVSDVYGPGEIALSGDLTAANFGRLAGAPVVEAEPADLAAAVAGLVGENVALICGGLAEQARLQRIVYGGSTLRGNPALARVLLDISARMGRQAWILEEGEFTGAVGALELAGVPDLRRTGEAAHDRMS